MESLFDQATLLRLAGHKSFARGLDYFRTGAVTELEFREQRHHAIVIGSEDYSVSLGWRKGELHGQCDCPAADNLSFCKHQVALGLAVLADSGTAIGDDTPDPPTPARKPTKASKEPSRNAQNHEASLSSAPLPVDDDDSIVRRWLTAASQSDLIDLIVQHTASDTDRWRGIVARARAALSPPEMQRDIVKTLIGSPRFVDPRRTMQYAQRLEPLFDIFDQQIRRDRSQALSLMLFAVKRLLKAYTSVDDSYGALGDFISRVGEIFAQAASKASQQDERFAKELFAILELDDWKVIHPLKDYAPALGEQGMQRLQRMAEQRLSALPANAQRFSKEAMAHSHTGRLLEKILDARGDLDALIEHKIAKLSTGYAYLELAELCAKHGRSRQATEWLERGLKFDPKDTRLHHALATRYKSEGFPEDALKLLRQAFELQPTDDHYAAVRKLALTLGQWPQTREQIDTVIERVATRFDSAENIRVRFKLIDGDIDAAWEIANQTLLMPDTLHALLKAVEADRPADAASLLKRLVDADLKTRTSSKYAEPIDLLKRMKRLTKKNDEAQNIYDATVLELRAKYARKRTLIEMMDGL